MGRLDPRFPQYGAARVAGGYALFGTLWIVFSDRLVASLAANEAQITFLQTIKGGAFVALSAIVLFGMVYREHRHLLSSNEELNAALQQVHILHRILRHNLRNITSIIGGSIYMIRSKNDGHVNEHCDVLRRQNERLINLSNKSRYLKQFLAAETDGSYPCNLARITAIGVEKVKGEYPNATITAELPEEAFVNAHHLIDSAVEELIENAIEHNPAKTPSVWLSIESGSKWVTLSVEDDGPGIPATERSTLLSEYETALEHSQGLGLWLVRLTIEESDGELIIGESDYGGAKTMVKLPTAQA